MSQRRHRTNHANSTKCPATLLSKVFTTTIVHRCYPRKTLSPQQSPMSEEPEHGRPSSPAPSAHEMVLLSSHASSHAPSYSDLFFDLLFAACLNTYSNAVSLEEFGNVAAFMVTLPRYGGLGGVKLTSMFVSTSKSPSAFPVQDMSAYHSCSRAGSLGGFLDDAFEFSRAALRISR